MSDCNSVKSHEYKGTPFSITYTPVENGKGYVNSSNVEVFFDGKSIGSYLRLYPDFVPTTFHPFLYKGEWYALYSADYTTTRVARLSPEGFEDWCGEESDSMGFCPTDFYVPRYKVAHELYRDKWLKHQFFENDFTESELDEYHSIQQEFTNAPETKRYDGEFYCEYGFLCGCIWGDDSSWKLRFIDLSGIENKELRVEERFGYFELPGTLRLRECIRHESVDRFELVQARHYSVKKGFVDGWAELNNDGTSNEKSKEGTCAEMPWMGITCDP